MSEKFGLYIRNLGRYFPYSATPNEQSLSRLRRQLPLHKGAFMCVGSVFVFLYSGRYFPYSATPNECRKTFGKNLIQIGNADLGFATRGDLGGERISGVTGNTWIERVGGDDGANRIAVWFMPRFWAFSFR